MADGASNHVSLLPPPHSLTFLKSAHFPCRDSAFAFLDVYRSVDVVCVLVDTILTLLGPRTLGALTLIRCIKLLRLFRLYR